MSALDTGIRLLPLSVTLLLAAIGVPRFLPNASPRWIVRIGLLSMAAGSAVLLAGIDIDAGAEIVAVPMLLMGLGMGALSSQLGAITVSSVPDNLSAEVGGLQNTASNLGASIGTALAGSILIAALTSAFLAGVQDNPDVPEQVKAQVSVELVGGIPFMSTSDLEDALSSSGVTEDVASTIVNENTSAQMVGLRSALSVIALAALAALFVTSRIPARQISAARDVTGLEGS